MRKLHSTLAWLVAALVVVQAASMTFGVAGMTAFAAQGGVIDKALLESRSLDNFVGELGFAIHALNGGLAIPLAAVLLLAVSFFTRARGARPWAGVVLGLVAVQTTLGYGLHDVPHLGILHGANALFLLAAAVQTALVVRRAGTVASEPTVRMADAAS